MKRELIIFLATSVLFVSGCLRNDRITELENRLKSTEAVVKALNIQVDLLKSMRSLDDTISESEKSALLTPGSDGYSVIKFDLGSMTIQLVDIIPYANGSKVSLKFGNPLASSIDGLKGTIEWGPVDVKGVPIEEKTKSKLLTTIALLKSGSWTNIDVVLEAVPPHNLGFIRIKNLGHTGIRLYP